MANTINRSYPLPDIAKTVKEEIENLQQIVLPMVDNDVQALFDAIALLAPIGHGHAIADITGLTDALAGKMSASTTFALSDLTDVVGAAAAPDGYVLAKVGAEFVAMSGLAALGPHGHLIADVSGLGTALTDITTDLGLKALATSVVRHDAAQALTAAAKGQARANIGADLLGGFRNKIINGDFGVNQRVGTRTPGLGVYGYDRWKGHASGLEQIVEALEAGDYTLTWGGGGSATFGGVTSTSPFVGTTAGGNVSVVVPSAATRVSLVEGDAAEADPFSPRHPQQELALCQRYYVKKAGGSYAVPFLRNTYQLSGIFDWSFHMRATPTIGYGSVVNGTYTSSVATESGAILIATPTSGSNCYFIDITADAEL